MIKSFADKETERIFHSEYVKKFSKTLQLAARRKLYSIDIAAQTSDLNIPPGNHLKRLKGKRIGQHSIRINAQ